MNRRGFTIVELLVVIVVIGILTAVTVVSYRGISERARDSRRLTDMHNITNLLELYKAQNGSYPAPSYNGPGGWESSSINPSGFLDNLKAVGVGTIPVDPLNSSTSMEYRYYRYGAGSHDCDVSLGDFYVLGIINMETSNDVDSRSPGWSCPSRDWAGEFEWVTGKFTN